MFTRMLVDYLACQKGVLTGTCGQEAASLWVDKISGRSVQAYANQESFGCRMYHRSTKTILCVLSIFQKHKMRNASLKQCYELALHKGNAVH